MNTGRKSGRIIIVCLIIIFYVGFLYVMPAYELREQQREKILKYSKQMNTEWKEEQKDAKRKAHQEGIPVRKQLADGRIIELQRYWQEIPLYYTTYNFEAAQTLSSDTVWPGGEAGFSLTGLGETLGVWDEGLVRTEHQEFGGRVTHKDGNTTLSDHATHVTGTMVASGVENKAKGMAYEARVHSYDWNNDLSEMANEAAAGMLVSNHSYGYISGWFYNFRGDDRWAWLGNPTVSETEDFAFGFYSESAAQWDEFCYNVPYFFPVVAAGNDRGYGPQNQPVEHWIRVNGQWELSDILREVNGGADGYDCISHFSLAKNVLSVGAVQGISDGYSQPEDVVMSSFSSWGPTDDGRIKPDIVAKGVSTYSTSSFVNIQYRYKSGTSMAAPNVAGSVGLLNQLYNQLYAEQTPLASTIRGLIIHTADQAGVSKGPDYIFGWGLMNTRRAADLMRADTVQGQNIHIREGALNNGDTYIREVESDGNNPLKVTISWTDPPGTPLIANVLNNPSPRLVNDLDLRIYGPDSTEYKPWILDHTNPSQPATTGDNYRDNVEQVYIGNPQAGNYIIEVSHKGLLVNGIQKYSLIVSGNYRRTSIGSELWQLY